MDIKMLIDGQLVNAKSGKVMFAVNPATEEIIGSAPLASEEDVDLACKSAAKAFITWSAQSIDQRARYLRLMASAIRDRAEEIVSIEVLDSGNTIDRVRSDVLRSAEALEYYAGLGQELIGKTFPTDNNKLMMTIRKPFGVCARIVPFNHPFMFIATRIGAPLMAGNTLVLKPAEQSPLSSGIFSEIAAAVLPPGVVNLVTGDGKSGDAIVRHPLVSRIAFTGSTETGLRIQQSAAQSGYVKHVSLELGGKNPMIVFPDADWEKAVDGAVNGMAFSWQGQSCGSTSRLLVHESIYDKTVKAVVEKIAQISVGDPQSDQTGMGPINSASQYERVLMYIELGKSEGATLAYGGVRPEQFDKGYWVLPTVFTNVTPRMRIAQEEVFGPILSIMKFATDDEALQLANETRYGLTAAVWTQNLQRALRFSEQLECGYVWVNGTQIRNQFLPFGGHKQSGIGFEGGIEELFSYSQIKTIMMV